MNFLYSNLIKCNDDNHQQIIHIYIILCEKNYQNFATTLKLMSRGVRRFGKA
jgi:hypothetical protein